MDKSLDKTEMNNTEFEHPKEINNYQLLISRLKSINESITFLEKNFLVK